MRRIVCEDCGKRYDFEKEDFCPKCGAFNQPVKTWGMDRQGNVIRVDGVNERNHAESFVHSEIHKEKHVRQARGMDWSGKTKMTRQPPLPPRQVAPQKRPSSQTQNNNAKRGLRALLYFFIALIVINFLIPLLVTLLSLF